MLAPSKSYLEQEKPTITDNKYIESQFLKNCMLKAKVKNNYLKDIQKIIN